MKEHDRAVLTRDLPDDGLVKGSTGTIVHVLADGAAYLVEVLDPEGDTVAVVEVSREDVRRAV